MSLYYLISNLWRFSFSAKYESGGKIPSPSIWRFDLNGYVYFEGNTYGEGHPMLHWGHSRNKFYIESVDQYGFVEFEFDALMVNISGKCILNDKSEIPFKGQIVQPLNDRLFYTSFKSYLSNKTWKLSMLGTQNLLYFQFGEQIIISFDAFGLKNTYYESNNMYDLIEEDMKLVKYIYKLEMQSVIIYEMTNMEKIGHIEMDDNRNLTGIYRPPFSDRQYFISLYEMTDILINEVLLEISEDQRLF